MASGDRALSESDRSRPRALRSRTSRCERLQLSGLLLSDEAECGVCCRGTVGGTRAGDRDDTGSGARGARADEVRRRLGLGGSEHEFRRAITLDPANPLAHYYSWLFMLLGRDDAAFSEARVGHQLAPSSRLAAVGRAQTLYLARQCDEAVDLCTGCLRFDPGYVFATHLRGLSYLGKSMHRSGRRHGAIRDAVEPHTVLHRYARTMLRRGRDA